MATRFELVLHGENPIALRAAGEEVLNEIDRLEAQLSLFRSSSEVAHLNARAAYEPVRVTPSLFSLLEHAQRLSRETDGAFDITVAPLVHCWGFLGGHGRHPSTEEVAAARARVGMQWVELDRAACSVRFAREGVMLDLGAIGKGYAIEQAVELLREAGVTSALVHGGTSSVYGLGHPPDAPSWKVAVGGLPEDFQSVAATGSAILAPRGSPFDPSTVPIATVELRDESLGVSGVFGKWFQESGRTRGHVIDPRTGEPVNRALVAAVILPSATETDALSTALLTLGSGGHSRISGLRPGMRSLVLAQAEGKLQATAWGIHPTESLASESP
jgi:thiamine biosynthesis lipoprotein